MLNYVLLLKQLYNHTKQSQHLPLSLILMIRTINIASTRLTAPIEAADEAEDETTVHTEAVEGEYTEEINNMEETKEQDFHRRDTMSIIN